MPNDNSFSWHAESGGLIGENALLPIIVAHNEIKDVLLPLLPREEHPYKICCSEFKPQNDTNHQQAFARIHDISLQNNERIRQLFVFLGLVEGDNLLQENIAPFCEKYEQYGFDKGIIEYLARRVVDATQEIKPQELEILLASFTSTNPEYPSSETTGSVVCSLWRSLFEQQGGRQ